MGQSSPKTSLRAGRAGEGKETHCGHGASVRKAQGQYTSPTGPELGALKSGAPQKGPTEGPREQSSSAGPLAVQNGLPVIRPRMYPAAGGLQLHVLIVAGCEEDVLPAGVGLSSCGQESST